MILESLVLDNFRSFEHLEVSFDQGANLLLGDNGAGKTNVLEAINYLALARSQRRESGDAEVAKFGSDSFRVRGVGKREGARTELDLTWTRIDGKRIKVDREPARRISDLIGRLPVVSFSPLDSILIWGPPLERRRFLDIYVSQMSPLYLAALQEYRAVLQQRNRILQNARAGTEEFRDSLEPWTLQLVEAGSRILAKRLEVLRRTSPAIALLSQKLSDSEEGMVVQYRPSFPLPEQTPSNGEEITRAFSEALTRTREQEIRLGLTLIGPHRDDLVFRWHDRGLKGYGSQGEDRICALALKLAFAQHLGQELGTSPILLLDEVFAELDERRSVLLLESIRDLGQVFLATAKETDVFTGGRSSYPHRRFRVLNGTVAAQ